MPLRPLIAGLLLAPFATALAAGIDPSQATKIDAVFAAFAKPGAPGCAFALYERGRVLYAKGYGLANVEHGVPIDPHKTVFDIGSTSKQFTAASILLLAQDGKLALDDSVRKHLPDLPAYFDAVTLDHLLRHTGGVRDYIALLMLSGISIPDHTTDADALAAIARQARLDFEPGSEHNYSNSGYFLLSQVVERASGKSLRAFAQERIFAPLGMDHTRFLDDHTLSVRHRASSYEPGPEGTWVLSTSAWEQTGDGAVQTTVFDLAKWDANFYEPKVGGKALVDQLQQTGVLADGKPLDYARGLLVTDYRGLRSVWHGGAWMGFRADLQRFPEAGIAAAALCNVGDASPTALLHNVADIVLADRLQPAEQPAHAEPAAAPAAPIAFSPSDYTGTYFGADDALLRRIELREGQLWYVRPQASDSALAYEGKHRFRMLEVPSPAFVQFAPGETGQRRMTLEMGDDQTVMREVAPFAAAADVLAGFAGTYDSAELDTRWRLFVDAGQLQLQARRGEPAPLTPAFADAFMGAGVLMRFQRDEAGAIAGFEVDVGRARGIAFTPVPKSSR